MNSRLAWAAAAGCLAAFTTACAHDGGDEPEVAIPVPDRCASEVFGIPVFWWDALSLKPGQVVELRPTIVRGPFSEAGVVGCLKDLTVSPAGPQVARGDDGIWRLTVPSDVPDGQVYKVQAQYAGRAMASAFIAFRPELQPLVGRWSQKAEECGGFEPLRELEFRADGNFSATWYPFETYKDYWGTYAYDPASGILTLQITGGNAVPGDAASGTIKLEGDRFEIGTASFGSRPSGTCPAAFVR